MKQENKVESKIDYVKPMIIDLGSVTPAIGGECDLGISYSSGDCVPGPTPKGEECTGNGSDAGAACASGIGFPT